MPLYIEWAAHLLLGHISHFKVTAVANILGRQADMIVSE